MLLLFVFISDVSRFSNEARSRHLSARVFHRRLLNLSTSVVFFSAYCQFLELRASACAFSSSTRIMGGETIRRGRGRPRGGCNATLSAALLSQMEEARNSLHQRADGLYDPIGLHLSPLPDSDSLQFLPPFFHSFSRVKSTSFRFCLCGRFIRLTTAEHTCSCVYVLLDSTGIVVLS